MDNIKDVINNVIGKIASKNPSIQNKTERIWKNVLEEQELKHTILSGIKDGALSVIVDSPAWLYQMRLKKWKILSRLRDEIPEIKDIRFRIGKIK